MIASLSVLSFNSCNQRRLSNEIFFIIKDKGERIGKQIFLVTAPRLEFSPYLKIALTSKV